MPEPARVVARQDVKSLDARLVDRLRERIHVGCDMSESVLELRQMGYTDAAILAGLEAARPRDSALAGGAMNSLPLIRRAPPNLRRLDNPRFALYALDDFMSAQECADLEALMAPRLKPSIVSHAYDDAAFRTSSTAELWNVREPLVLAIDERICRTLGIRPAYSEGIQAQRYEVGQQFKPHRDCFEPGTNTYQRLAGMRGNRTWTFMVYLNDDLQGGATHFTDIGHSVQPKRGMALLWNNLLEDGSPNKATTHCGEPVTHGHKAIITKWFRVFGDGPVFYEPAVHGTRRP
jgi:prolyl 4-hydroxylase